jgi:hypothetical protein
VILAVCGAVIVAAVGAFIALPATLNRSPARARSGRTSAVPTPPPSAFAPGRSGAAPASTGQ